MPESHIVWVMQELARVGVKAVTLEGGGEPARGHLVCALDVAREHGLQVGLITNGTLDTEQLDAAVRSCLWVRVSLDAGTRETHARIHETSPRDWDRILRNVDTLVRAGVTAGLSFLICKENELDAMPFIWLCEELNVSYGTIKELFYPDRIAVPYSPNAPWAIEAPRASVPITTSRMSPSGYQYAPQCWASRVVGPKIDPTGEMYVCCNHLTPEYSFGVWCDGQPFEEIWGGDRRRLVMDWVTSSEWNANERCGLCKIDCSNWIADSLVNPSPHVNFPC